MLTYINLNHLTRKNKKTDSISVEEQLENQQYIQDVTLFLQQHPDLSNIVADRQYSFHWSAGDGGKSNAGTIVFKENYLLSRIQADENNLADERDSRYEGDKAIKKVQLYELSRKKDGEQHKIGGNERNAALQISKKHYSIILCEEGKEVRSKNREQNKLYVNAVKEEQEKSLVMASQQVAEIKKISEKYKIKTFERGIDYVKKEFDETEENFLTRMKRQQGEENLSVTFKRNDDNVITGAWIGESEETFRRNMARISRHYRNYMQEQDFADPDARTCYIKNESGVIVQAKLPMRYLYGKDLFEAIKCGKMNKFSDEERFQFAVDYLAQLAAMQKKFSGFCFGDLKAENTVIKTASSKPDTEDTMTDRNRQPSIMLIDLELASTQQERQGTEEYEGYCPDFSPQLCPPEALSPLAAQLIKPESDTYSAAFVLVQLLYGHKALYERKEGEINVPVNENYTEFVTHEISGIAGSRTAVSTDAMKKHQILHLSTKESQEINGYLIRLITQMQEWDPDDRPSIKQITEIYDGIHEIYKGYLHKAVTHNKTDTVATTAMSADFSSGDESGVSSDFDGENKETLFLKGRATPSDLAGVCQFGVFGKGDNNIASRLYDDPRISDQTSRKI